MFNMSSACKFFRHQRLNIKAETKMKSKQILFSQRIPHRVSDDCHCVVDVVSLVAEPAKENETRMIQIVKNSLKRDECKHEKNERKNKNVRLTFPSRVLTLNYFSFLILKKISVERACTTKYLGSLIILCVVFKWNHSCVRRCLMMKKYLCSKVIKFTRAALQCIPSCISS